MVKLFKISNYKVFKITIFADYFRNTCLKKKFN